MTWDVLMGMDTTRVCKVSAESHAPRIFTFLSKGRPPESRDLIEVRRRKSSVVHVFSCNLESCGNERHVVLLLFT